MLALLITSCVHDKGQTAGERNATWQEWTRAIFSLAGQTPTPELSPQRLFTWPTGERKERERARESWHGKPLALLPPSHMHNLSVFLWWQRLSLGTIFPVLKTGHQLPYDTLHYLPPVSSTTSSQWFAWPCNVSHTMKKCLKQHAASGNYNLY